MFNTDTLYDRIVVSHSEKFKWSAGLTNGWGHPMQTIQTVCSQDFKYPARYWEFASDSAETQHFRGSGATNPFVRFFYLFPELKIPQKETQFYKDEAFCTTPHNSFILFQTANQCPSLYAERICDFPQSRIVQRSS